MLSLADHDELVGFFSYSRDDDEDSDNGLSRLRMRIQNELRAQMGRSRESLRLWQDREAIAAGALWEGEIDQAVQSSSFFIPIITPRVVRSKYCQLEFDKFVAREQELRRNDLIFPILYIGVGALETEKSWRDDPVLRVVGERQYVDWRGFRHEPDSVALRRAIEEFCKSIVLALERQPAKARPLRDVREPDETSPPPEQRTSLRFPNFGRPFSDVQRFRRTWPAGRNWKRDVGAALMSGVDWAPHYSGLYFLVLGAMSGLVSLLTFSVIPIEIDKYLRPGLFPAIMFSACLCYMLYHTAKILTWRMSIILPVVSLGWITAVNTAARITLYFNEARMFSAPDSGSQLKWTELASGGLVGGLIGGSSVILAIMLCGKTLLGLRSAFFSMVLAIGLGLFLVVSDRTLMMTWQGGLLGFIAFSLRAATPDRD